MQTKIEAFIDSYEFITILIDKEIDSDDKELYKLIPYLIFQINYQCFSVILI